MSVFLQRLGLLSVDVGAGLPAAPQPDFANIHFMPDHENMAHLSTAMLDAATGGIGNPHNSWSYTGDAKNDSTQTRFGSGTAISLWSGSIWDNYHIDYRPDSAETNDTAEFCYEMDVRMKDVSYNQFLYSRYVTTGNQRTFFIEYYVTTGTFRFAVWYTGSDLLFVFEGTTTIDVDTWYHLALTRENGYSGTPGAEDKITMWVDGVEDGFVMVGTTEGIYQGTTYGPNIGDLGSGGGQARAYLDNMRITMGEPVYTEPFTPPVARHPLPPPSGIEIVGVDGVAEGPTWTPAIRIPAGSTGDLLLAFVSLDQSTIPTAPTGWLQLYNNNWYDTTACFYRVTDGTEGATAGYSVSAYDRQCHVCFRLSGCSGNVEYTMGTGSATLNPDPPSLTPSWGAKENMWFTGVAFDHGSRSISVIPTGYGNLTEYGHNLSHNGGADIALAYQLLDAATNDPSTFTMSDAGSYNQVIPWTVAVEPA